MTCGDLPTVETSSTLIRVLFQNLISNALKFQNGSKPPEIQIDAEQHETTSGDFRCATTASASIPAFQDRMFTIFQRFHRKEGYPGTGIGLCTCRKFIQLCGGDIGFEIDARSRHRLFLFAPAKGHWAPCANH